MVKKILLLLVLYSTQSLSIATEGTPEKIDPFKGGEKIEEPKTGQEADKLEERYEETKEEAQEAKERLESNKEKLNDPTLSKEEEAQLNQQINQDQKLVNTYEQAGKILDDPKVQEQIKEYKEQLKKDIETGKIKIPADQMPTKLEEAFKTNDSVGLIEIRDAFNKTIDLDALSKKIAQTKDIKEKFKIIDEIQENIDAVRTQLEKELQAIKNKEKEVSLQYQNVLKEFKELILNKDMSLNEQTFAIDVENIGFFAKLAKGIRDWFAKNFGFLKKGDKIVNQEIETTLATIKKNIKNVKPLERRFFNDVEKLNQNADRLVKVINNTIKSGIINEAIYKSHEKRVKAMIQLIDKLEKKVSPAQKEQIDEAFENLRQLNAELGLETKRYRGESPTLYQSELAAFKGELDLKKLGKPLTIRNKAFEPNELYEALGLTKEKLGFDPQNNPEKITLQQIKDADAAQRKVFKNKENTYEYQAARNAYAALGTDTGKALYDAFLKDFNALKQQDFDPLQPKSKARNWLNDKGDLSKFEISKELRDKIYKVQGDIGEGMSNIGMRSYDHQSLSQQLAETKNNLQDALTQAQAALKSEQPEGPPQ